MVKAFQKRQPKGRKVDGNYLFADFTEGLYLLDTPRNMPEQLGSLALVGGRNVYTERGALIPQYGYLEKGKVPSGEVIVGVTEDTKSNASVFIITMSGRIYYYSAYDGLKKYSTTTDVLSEDIIYTRMNNNIVLSNAGNTFIFGSYYKESDYVETVNNATVGNFGTYALIDVPEGYADYFWRGKIIVLKGVGAANITSIKTSTVLKSLPFPIADLDINKTWSVGGNIPVDDSDKSVVIDPISGTKIQVSHKEVQDEGETIEVIKTKWQCYKYSYDTSLDLVKALKTFSKVPMTGYLYTQGNAKLNSVMYFYGTGANPAPSGQEPNQSTYTYKINKTTFQQQTGVNSMGGNSANMVGLKMLKPSATELYAKAGTLTRVSSGDIKVKTTETLPAGKHTVYQVTATLPFTNGTTKMLTTDNLQAGQLTWEIENNSTTHIMTYRLKSGDSVIYSQQFSTTGLNQLLCVTNNPQGMTPDDIWYTDSSGQISNQKEIATQQLTVIPYGEDTDFNLIKTESIDVGEQTLHPITLEYKPEDSTQTPITINPRLFGTATNRLLVYDVTGTIYYSAVGILDEFSQVAGAGFFRDFYNDTSECLKIEDYLSGCLITKQNGLYYVLISDNYASQSVAANNDSGLRIQKVSEIGQEYAGDHIIVGNSVYAFDTHSGSIVIGCTQNMFGNVVAGDTLIPSEYVGAVDLGLIDQKRRLMYSPESEVFILYFGEALNRGLVITKNGSLFPRELNKTMFDFVRFNQGILSVSSDGLLANDFKQGTVVPELSAIANFEPIALLDSRMIFCSILEVLELNGVKYNLTATNVGTSYQQITPYTNYGIDGVELPPLLYSQTNKLNDSFGTLPSEENLSLQELAMIKQITKWAKKKSNLTRIYTPMSGREGITLSFEFQPDVAFCLVGLRLADFSQGE